MHAKTAAVSRCLFHHHLWSSSSSSSLSQCICRAPITSQRTSIIDAFRVWWLKQNFVYTVSQEKASHFLFSIISLRHLLSIVFDRFLCLYVSLFLSFLSFFVSLLERLRENGWTDLHEIFTEGVEWPWDDPITFLVNSEKPRDSAMHNTGAGFVVLYQHSLLQFLKHFVRK